MCCSSRSSRSSSPASRSCMIAAAVNVFVIEPTRYCVSVVGLLITLDVRDTDRLLPHELAVPDRGSVDRRDPFACLGLADEAGQLGDGRLRLRQASSTPRE